MLLKEVPSPITSKEKFRSNRQAFFQMAKNRSFIFCFLFFFHRDTKAIDSRNYHECVSFILFRAPSFDGHTGVSDALRERFSSFLEESI